MDKKVTTLPFIKSKFHDLIEDLFKKEQYDQALIKINEYEQLFDLTIQHELLRSICLFEYGKEPLSKELLIAFFSKNPKINDNHLSFFKQTVIFYEGLEQWTKWFENNFPKYSVITSKINKNPIEHININNEVDIKLSTPNVLLQKEWNHVFIENNNTTLQIEWLYTSIEKPILPIKNEVQEFLMSDNKNPFIKTLILEWIGKQDVNYTIKICKFGSELDWNLNDYPSPFETNYFLDIVRKLQYNYEKNPSYLELSIDILKKYILVFYPFENINIEKLIEAINVYIIETFGNNEECNYEINEIKNKLILAQQIFLQFS
ncbi:MAG: hypothetical protein K0S51_191 [Bacillales bacterium]|jgi:hypothetical protein|nr:hypothetical protein [Bacillales bacterium]